MYMHLLYMYWGLHMSTCICLDFLNNEQAIVCDCSVSMAIRVGRVIYSILLGLNISWNYTVYLYMFCGLYTCTCKIHRKLSIFQLTKTVTQLFDHIIFFLFAGTYRDNAFNRNAYCD